MRSSPARLHLVAGLVLMLCSTALLTVPRLNARHLLDTLWSDNVVVSTPGAVPKNPAVALSDTDQAYAVWHDAQSGAAGGINVASQSASGAWTPPIRIPNSGTGNPSLPTVAAGPTGDVYVAWVSGFPETRADILFTWSTDGGRTWQAPVQVNTDVGDIAGHPDLTVDARGNVHLVWSDLATFGDPHSRDVKGTTRPAGQETWTEPAVVHPDVGVYTAQARPAVAADGRGNVYAIWEDARHGPDDPHAIYAARLPAGSTQWEPSRRVDHRVGEANRQPDIAVAPDGTAHAIWEGGPAGDVYSAVLRPGAEVWDDPTNVRRREKGEREKGEKGKGEKEERGQRIVNCELRIINCELSIDNSQFTIHNYPGPRIAVDGRGAAYAVWQDDRSSDWDIYAAVRWPGAAWWSQNMRVNDDMGVATQAEPAIAAGEAGHAAAVWSDQRNSSLGAVYAAELQLAIHTARLPLLVND